jgi:hypothetical protein
MPTLPVLPIIQVAGVIWGIALVVQRLGFAWGS